MRRLVLSAALAASAARGDFDPAAWRYRKPIATAGAGLTALTVDRDVYTHAQPGLADARIVRGGLEVAWVTQRGPWRERFEPRLARTEDRRATLLTGDLGAPGIPYDQVTVETGAASFYRRAEVEAGATADDEKRSSAPHSWVEIARGSLYRTPAGEGLMLLFPERMDRWVRVRIYNEDDRPIPDLRMALSGLATRLIFIAEAGPHWLYYGSPAAHTPRYDLARTLDRTRDPVGVALGAQELNPAYRPPRRPWSEEHPAVLTTALAIAVLALGYVIARFWFTIVLSTRGKPR